MRRKQTTAVAAAVIATAAALALPPEARAVAPRIVTLTSVSRHATMTFDAPRAVYVTVTIARNPAQDVLGEFLAENVVHAHFLTDAENEAGSWIDERQLDPGTYYVMIRALPEQACRSFPPPTFEEVLDPSCANGPSAVATLVVPRPAQRHVATVARAAGGALLRLGLTVRPLGEPLPYRVCWRARTGKRACVRRTVYGTDWDAAAADSVFVRSRLVAARTTFTWYVGTRVVARKAVRVRR
jgi:hypothetical protein